MNQSPKHSSTQQQSFAWGLNLARAQDSWCLFTVLKNPVWPHSRVTWSRRKERAGSSALCPLYVSPARDLILWSARAQRTQTQTAQHQSGCVLWIETSRKVRPDGKRTRTDSSWQEEWMAYTEWLEKAGAAAIFVDNGLDLFSSQPGSTLYNVSHT